MRTFIKTENGKYVDAAHISELSTSGSGGGTVTLAVNPMEEHVVARAADKPKMGSYGTEETTEQERDARREQAAVLAESLIHAISRTEAIAKQDGNGAVIRFDTESRRWAITDLGKVATSPLHP